MNYLISSTWKHAVFIDCPILVIIFKQLIVFVILIRFVTYVSKFNLHSLERTLFLSVNEM